MSKIHFGLEKYNHFSNSQVIKDIVIINADVKLIKCKIEGTSIDISINNFLGLTKLAFMRYIENSAIKQIDSGVSSQLFKRTVILIKAWMNYEASLLGSNVGLMATYALETLIIFFFNSYASLVKNELLGLFYFLKVMSEVDYDRLVITIFGTIPKEALMDKIKRDEAISLLTIINTSNINPGLIEKVSIFQEMFAAFKDLDKIQIFNSSKRVMNLKNINIADALFDANNLGKSVNYANYTKMDTIFKYMAEEIDQICKKANKLSFSTQLSEGDYLDYLNMLLRLFRKTIVAHNDELQFLNLPQPQIIISARVFNSKNISNEIASTCITGQSNNNSNFVREEDIKELRLESKSTSPERDNYDQPHSNEDDKILLTPMLSKKDSYANDKRDPQTINNESKGNINSGGAIINQLCDNRKQNTHNSHSLVNSQPNSNASPPYSIPTSTINSAYLNIMGVEPSNISPQIPAFRPNVERKLSTPSTVSKESLIAEFAKTYSSQSSQNKNIIRAQPSIHQLQKVYTYSSYVWPNTMDIKNQQDKVLLLNNMSAPALRSNSFVSKDILEFFNKNFNVSTTAIVSPEIDKENEEVEQYLQYCYSTLKDTSK